MASDDEIVVPGRPDDSDFWYYIPECARTGTCGPREKLPRFPETPAEPAPSTPPIDEVPPPADSPPGEEPPPPTQTIVVDADPLPPPSFAFVGPAPNVLPPFLFLPKVAEIAVTAKRTVASRLFGFAAGLASRLVGGIGLLLWSDTVNRGETEALDAYYRQSKRSRPNPSTGGKPGVGSPDEIQVTARRLRAPIGPLPVRVAPGVRNPPLRDPIGATYPRALEFGEEPEASPLPAERPLPPLRPPRTPVIAPAAPLDPDEEDAWLPRPAPRRTRRPRFPVPPGEIAPDVVTFPIGDPLLDPLTQPAPLPAVSPRPSPIVSPVVSPFPLVGDPLSEPIYAPVTSPTVQPFPRVSTPRPISTPVRAPRLPSPFETFPPVSFLTRPKTRPVPFPGLGAPPKQADPCNCVKQKKPRKQRQPRDVCWRGTYVELRNGLIKHRKEKVPCQ